MHFWTDLTNKIGSGGGLGITISQIKFPVDIKVASTIFENNILKEAELSLKESMVALSISLVQSSGKMVLFKIIVWREDLE